MTEEEKSSNVSNDGSSTIEELKKEDDPKRGDDGGNDEIRDESSSTTTESTSVTTTTTSQLFKGVTFCMCDDLGQATEVKTALIDRGGKLVNYLTDIVTHLIADKDDHPHVTDALEIYEKPVVTPSWVFQSIACGILLPTKAFSPLRTQLFSNVRICPSKLSKRDVESVWAIITFYGGTCSHKLDDKVTHLVVGKAEGLKYDKALQLGSDKIKIVTPDWITESINSRSLCDEEIYHPRLLMLPIERPIDSAQFIQQPSLLQTSLAGGIRQIAPGQLVGGGVSSRGGIRFVVPNHQQPNQQQPGVRLMHIQRTPAGHIIRTPSVQSALGFTVDPQPTGPSPHQQPRQQVFLSVHQQPQIRQQEQFDQSQLQQFQFVQQNNQQNNMDQQQNQAQQSQQQHKPPNQVILQQRVQPPVHTMSVQQNLQQQQQKMVIQQQQQQQQTQQIQQSRLSLAPRQGAPIVQMQRVPNGQLIRVSGPMIHPQQQQMNPNFQSQQQPPPHVLQHQNQQNQAQYQMIGGSQQQQMQVQRVPQVRMMPPQGPHGPQPQGMMMRPGPHPQQQQIIMTSDGNQQRIYFRPQTPPGSHQVVQEAMMNQQGQYIRQPMPPQHQQQYIQHPQQPQPVQQQWQSADGGPMIIRGPPPQGMMMHHPQQHPQQPHPQMIQQQQWPQQQQMMGPQRPQMIQQQQPMMPMQNMQQQQLGQQQVQRVRFTQQPPPGVGMPPGGPGGVQIVHRPGMMHPQGVSPHHPRQPIGGMIHPQTVSPGQHPPVVSVGVRGPHGHMTPTANIIPSTNTVARVVGPTAIRSGTPSSTHPVSCSSSSSSSVMSSSGVSSLTFSSSSSSTSTLVTPKTKTALANLLSTRLANNSSNMSTLLRTSSGKDNSCSNSFSTPTSLVPTSVVSLEEGVKLIHSQVFWVTSSGDSYPLSSSSSPYSSASVTFLTPASPSTVVSSAASTLTSGCRKKSVTSTSKSMIGGAVREFLKRVVSSWFEV